MENTKKPEPHITWVLEGVTSASDMGFAVGEWPDEVEVFDISGQARVLAKEGPVTKGPEFLGMKYAQKVFNNSDDSGMRVSLVIFND